MSVTPTTCLMARSSCPACQDTAPTLPLTLLFPLAPLPLSSLQANEIRSSVKYQLKKVLCLGVAVGNVNMAERELYINIQVRRAEPG